MWKKSITSDNKQGTSSRNNDAGDKDGPLGSSKRGQEQASAAPTFPFTEENTNYFRLCRLLVDVGSHVLRETFDKNRPPGELENVLGSPSAFATLRLLRKKKILNLCQWKKLYPANKSSVSTKNFDITLLIVLLRSICDLTPPATGWDVLPSPTDLSLEADIARIKFYRNTVCGHPIQASIDNSAFDNDWKNIRDALVRLGGAAYEKAIDYLKWDCLIPQHSEHYKYLIKEWEMNTRTKPNTILNIFLIYFENCFNCI